MRMCALTTNTRDVFWFYDSPILSCSINAADPQCPCYALAKLKWLFLVKLIWTSFDYFHSFISSCPTYNRICYVFEFALLLFCSNDLKLYIIYNFTLFFGIFFVLYASPVSVSHLMLPPRSRSLYGSHIFPLLYGITVDCSPAQHHHKFTHSYREKRIL